jgi:hypothetical protein
MSAREDRRTLTGVVRRAETDQRPHSRQHAQITDKHRP